jgi:hypothetical protein
MRLAKRFIVLTDRIPFEDQFQKNFEAKVFRNYSGQPQGIAPT